MVNRGGFVAGYRGSRLKYSLTHVVVWLVVCGLVGGCSLGGTSFQSPEHRERSGADKEDILASPQGAHVELRPLQLPSETVSAIEVLWEVPTEPVEGFVVRYGQAHEELSVERRLTVADIERVEDPTRGRLYRFVIEGIPTTQRLFLSIAAFNGGQESPPSKVFEVHPGQPE